MRPLSLSRDLLPHPSVPEVLRYHPHRAQPEPHRRNSTHEMPGGAPPEAFRDILPDRWTKHEG